MAYTLSSSFFLTCVHVGGVGTSEGGPKSECRLYASRGTLGTTESRPSASSSPPTPCRLAHHPQPHPPPATHHDHLAEGALADGLEQHKVVQRGLARGHGARRGGRAAAGGDSGRSRGARRCAAAAGGQPDVRRAAAAAGDGAAAAVGSPGLPAGRLLPRCGAEAAAAARKRRRGVRRRRRPAASGATVRARLAAAVSVRAGGRPAGRAAGAALLVAHAGAVRGRGAWARARAGGANARSEARAGLCGGARVRGACVQR